MARLPYATFEEYCAIKDITIANLTATETATIKRYLERGSDTIDGVVRRRFFPDQETRRYSIPSNYVDLRQRAFIRDDLPLDRDLLEVQRVQLGINNSIVEMFEVVQGGGITALTTSITVANASGLDQLGNSPRISIGDILRIENELCPVVDVDYNTNVVRIQRGAFDTIALAHAAGVDVQKLSLVTLTPGIEFHLLDFNIRPAVGIRIVWPATWAGRFTGSSWRFRYPQIYVTGYWCYHEHKDEWWVNTNLTTGVSGWDTTVVSWTPNLSATDETGDPSAAEGYLYRVDNELIWGGAISGSTQALVRGRQGTTNVSHAANAPIYRFQVMREIMEATVDVAKTLRDQDEAVGGRQGTSDMSIGFQPGYSKTTTATLARFTRSIL